MSGFPEQDITGQKFGNLIAQHRVSPKGKRPLLWAFKCDCGKVVSVSKCNVICGYTKSCVDCGHKTQDKKITKHGMCNTREYHKYAQAKSRCQCPTNARYKDYGGRGIEFKFESFKQFFSELGICPPNRTLDRIDNGGHYEIGNVRWATSEEQYGIGRRRKKSSL
jgi:hypothetical protein